MASARVDELLAVLTVDEKISLTAGNNSWETVPIERLGLPSMRVSDGPNGARGTGWNGTNAHCFPCGTALGATFDTALVEEVGVALGDEVRTKGARVLLAPTVNLHRTPMGGRNFECMSEDPELTAQLAVAYVNGVQSRQVACCIKHFVANDTEQRRMTIDSQVDENVLRRMYFRPFQHAVQRANVRSVMTSYNVVNGVHADMNSWLLSGVLRGEWEFDGVVMSDWGGTNSTAQSLRAGLDLEMPGPANKRGQALNDAFENGEVSMADIDNAVVKLLHLMEWTGALDSSGPEEEIYADSDEVRQLIKRTAVESFVLLKNRHSALPLVATSSEIIALIGPNVDRLAVMGGGSAQVRTAPLGWLTNAFGDAMPNATLTTAPGCSTRRELPHLTGTEFDGGQISYFDSLDCTGDSVQSLPMRRTYFMVGTDNLQVADKYRFSARLTGSFVPQVGGEYVVGFATVCPARLFIDDELIIDQTDPTPGNTFIATGSTELRTTINAAQGRRYELRVDYINTPRGGVPMNLHGLSIGVERIDSVDPVEAAVAVASQADVTVLVVGTSGEWETEGTDQESYNLPGRQDELVARVAAASKRTIVVLNVGSPCAMPWIDDVDAVLVTWFGGEELAHAIADVVAGLAEPGGRLPVTWPHNLADTPAIKFHPSTNDIAEYGEGLLIGYRWYDRRGIEPLYPFGYGLGYTEISLSEPRRAGTRSIEVTMTNVGGASGSTVAQVYAMVDAAPLEEPVKELVGFAKVWLAPGESRRVSVAIELPTWISEESGLVVGQSSGRTINVAG